MVAIYHFVQLLKYHKNGQIVVSFEYNGCVLGGTDNLTLLVYKESLFIVLLGAVSQKEVLRCYHRILRSRLKSSKINQELSELARIISISITKIAAHSHQLLLMEGVAGYYMSQFNLVFEGYMML